LNSEIYPAFKEVGFDVRSEGPSPMPALIDAPRRGPDAAKEADKGPAVVPPPAATPPPATPPKKK
jgi:hypothetical protein